MEFVCVSIQTNFRISFDIRKQLLHLWDEVITFLELFLLRLPVGTVLLHLCLIITIFQIITDHPLQWPVPPGQVDNVIW